MKTRDLIGVALLVLSLNAGAAQSQPPAPNPTRAAQPVKNTAPRPQQQPAANQRGTKDNPLFVDIVPAPDAEKRETEEREERKQASAVDDRLGRYTLWLAITTAGLGAVAIWQGFLIRRQSKLSREEFISAHRPRLRVRNFDTHTPGDLSKDREPFKQNEIVSGQFYITNIGGTTATVTAIGCWVDWREGKLPRIRPYEGKNANVQIGGSLAPGQSMPVVFGSEEAMPRDTALIRQRSNGWGLYLLGWVEYRDAMGYVRRTEFCRAWHPESSRYEPVSDPDYEYEE